MQGAHTTDPIHSSHGKVTYMLAPYGRQFSVHSSRVHWDALKLNSMGYVDNNSIKLLRTMLKDPRPLKLGFTNADGLPILHDLMRCGWLDHRLVKVVGFNANIEPRSFRHGYSEEHMVWSIDPDIYDWIY